MAWIACCSRSVKAQSALEFLVSYAWALILIAVVLGIFIYFISLPKTIVPTGCSFSYGIDCRGLIIGSNSVTTQIGLIVVNSQAYDLIGPTNVIINVSGYGITTLQCIPSNVPSGSATLCSGSMSEIISPGSGISGTITMNSQVCLTGTAENCAAERVTSYIGNFTGYSQTYTKSIPVNIVLYESSSGIAVPNPVVLTAYVSMMGLPAESTSVQFSTNSPQYSSVSPEYSLTNIDGNASSTFSATVGGVYLVTASFAGFTSSNVITVAGPGLTTVAPPPTVSLTFSAGTSITQGTTDIATGTTSASGDSISIEDCSGSGCSPSTVLASGTTSTTYNVGSLASGTYTLDACDTTASICSAANVLIVTSSGPTVPSGIVEYVPITLTNSQSSALTSSTQIMISLDAATYSTYEAGNLDNAEFFYYNGVIINSWMEGNILNEQQTSGLNTAADIIYWINGVYIPASGGTNTVYLGWASTSTNLLNGVATGEAPQLSSTYAQYDNGAAVFPYYTAWGGLSAPPSGWTEISSTVQSYQPTYTEFQTSSTGTYEGFYLSTPASMQQSAAPFAVDFYGSVYPIGTTTSGLDFWGLTSVAPTTVTELKDDAYMMTSNSATSADLAFYSNSAGTTLGNYAYAIRVYSMVQSSSTSADVLYDYTSTTGGAGVTVDPTQSSSYYGYYTDAGKLQGEVIIYWDRSRVAPPNGVMPTASFGSVV